MSARTDQLDIITQAVNKLYAMEAAPASSYQARTDRNTYPKPAPVVLGQAGFSFHDPTYGTRLLRVTDGLSQPGLSYEAPSNTYLAAWQADSKGFYVWGPSGPHRYTFDPDAFIAQPVDLLPSQVEPTFSRVDLNTAYGVGGPISRTVQRYRLNPASVETVLDLDALGLPGLVEPRTYAGSIMVGGDPERIAVSYGGQSQGGHYLVTVIHPDGRLQHLNTVERGDYHIHSIGMDLSGRWVAISPNNAQPYQLVFWDLDTDTLHPETVAPWGHGALGYGIQTNMCPVDGTPWDARQWVLRSLTDLEHPSNLIAPVLTPQEIYTADHQSWNNAKPDVRMPVLSSTFRTAAGQSAPWLPWIDEILALDTNGSGLVYRFAHHRSDPSDGFWSQPILHIAPNGQYAIFTSNWEKQLGLDVSSFGGFRNDVFLVELI